jgi:outer membrane protein assembly factor BamB
MKRTIHLAVFLSVYLAGSVSGAPWPTFMHDNARVGATDHQLAAPLAAAWVYATPAPPEMAWEGPRGEQIEGLVMRHRVAFDRALPVVVANGRTYFGSSVDHQLYCLNTTSGEILWTFYAEGPIRMAPTIWQDRVYFGAEDGVAYCLDAVDGRLIWQLRAGPGDERLLARGRMISRWPIRTGVMIEKGIAYFGAGVFPHETIYLYAVDALTGQVIWKNDRISQQDAGRNPLSPQGYLLGNAQMLIVPSGRSLPAAFDGQQGELIHHLNHAWRTTAGGEVGGWRAMLADGQIYSSGSHHFLAMNQKTGATGHAWITGRQLTMSGDRAFFATGDRIVAVDRPKHAKATVERQKYNLERYNLRRDRAKYDAQEFARRDAELGEKIRELSEVGALWSVASDLDSSLIVAGDWLIAGGAGRVDVLAVEDGRRIWTAEVDGDASSLAVAEGRLFVSTDTGKIYAFSSEASSEPRSILTQSADDGPPYPDDELSQLYAAAAQQILNATSVDRGYCLVVGSERGRLAYELAKRSQLRIYGIEADGEKVAASREALHRAGLYGHRVSIVHGKPDELPFSNYFANLVVSDSLRLYGRLPADPANWSRCVKPCGGAVCLLTDGHDGTSQPLLRLAISILDFEPEAVDESEDGRIVAVRGGLAGAGSWSHQYGDAANTMASQDQRVRGGLAVLWYGDPGPSKMINRHDAAASPLSTAGRMFIQGVDSILCYDAYNGLFLWEYENPGALRTGVFNNEESSNLAAADDALFVAVDNACTELDAATGQVRRVHHAPQSSDGVPRAWGYVACEGDLLFGTATINSELDKALKRRGRQVDQKTDALFAIDRTTGEQRWIYRGRNIMHVTIAIGDDRVFFIDSSITAAEREALLQQDKSDLVNLPPEEARRMEEQLKTLDVRLAVCLDAHTGQLLWSQPVDVTDCSRIGIGGGQLTLIYHDGHVLICGANANGHYWKQFLAGEFSRRRLVVLNAADGKFRWAADANYRSRPIIVGAEIIAEPWAFDLHTGQQKMSENPLTGQPEPWQFSRPGHHCGPITGAPNMLFFRSGDTSYYDLYDDSGTSHFAGHRLGCWVNAIPGNGLLMVPEASAGCVCQYSIASTVVLEPRDNRDTWKIYSSPGGSLPVQRLNVNLGAPGDRRDRQGTLWLSYPRPTTRERLEFAWTIKRPRGPIRACWTPCCRFSASSSATRAARAMRLAGLPKRRWMRRASRSRNRSVPRRARSSSPAVRPRATIWRSAGYASGPDAAGTI